MVSIFVSFLKSPFNRENTLSLNERIQVEAKYYISKN